MGLSGAHSIAEYGEASSSKLKPISSRKSEERICQSPGIGHDSAVACSSKSSEPLFRKVDEDQISAFFHVHSA
ncbi:unnamed protein product [Acanthoscelides obtectus]|uniref:Uncharacterized protein n=1 Tax=Acanthoscelides obtectus TaxID=200917 RepID=A0A9P0NSD4_ACAOB|nr:unnamed protein product [Acanthoscelides obtectus]CAK1649959.1 hypothetical protein AOBTE_LOCUS16515 [Acanthoscelides obtectus]